MARQTSRPQAASKGKSQSRPGPGPKGKPAGQTGGKPSYKSATKPEDKPAYKPAGKPSGKPGDKPVRKPNGRPGDKPARKPNGRPGKRPDLRPDLQEVREPAAFTEPAAFPNQTGPEDMEDQAAEIISGRHPVLEALKSGATINKVWLADTVEASFSSQIHQLCRELSIPCHRLPKAKLTAIAGPEHRGVAAELAAVEYVEVEDLLDLAREKGEDPLIIVLDNVEDPHNLGAVIRTALAAGAHGVVTPRRRAAALNRTVLAASAGAANYLPIARVGNLNQALDRLQQAGCWTVAGDMEGDELWQAHLSGPLALVMGSEGSGVSPLLKSRCDQVASIPMRGRIGSLNVSAAAAVLLYEAVRQRKMK